MINNLESIILNISPDFKTLYFFFKKSLDIIKTKKTMSVKYFTTNCNIKSQMCRLENTKTKLSLIEIKTPDISNHSLIKSSLFTIKYNKNVFYLHDKDIHQNMFSA